MILRRVVKKGVMRRKGKKRGELRKLGNVNRLRFGESRRARKSDVGDVDVDVEAEEGKWKQRVKEEGLRFDIQDLVREMGCET